MFQKIVIERTLKIITVTISTSRPGLIIGKGGQEVDKLKEELKKITSKDVQVNIFEIKRPELDAKLVARNIANQIEGGDFLQKGCQNGYCCSNENGCRGNKGSSIWEVKWC